MTRKRHSQSFDQKAIRHWTLYVIRFSDATYYIGITSYKDFMRRIRQHGGKAGARINQNKTVDAIVEIHPLGRMTGAAASRIENDMMLEYRKRFGASKVRGGYEISQRTSIIPTFTPGSWQLIVFTLFSLLLAVSLLILVSRNY